MNGWTVLSSRRSWKNFPPPFTLASSLPPKDEIQNIAQKYQKITNNTTILLLNDE